MLDYFSYIYSWQNLKGMMRWLLEKDLIALVVQRKYKSYAVKSVLI